MTKYLIIIGAGIAGLSTGCYEQMNGYATKIYEMNNKPGGVCTSWKREDYVFDYCIHNLAGMGRNSDVRQIWEEWGAFEGTPILDHEIFVIAEGPQGEAINFYTNLNRLGSHLKEIAPEGYLQNCMRNTCPRYSAV